MGNRRAIKKSNPDCARRSLLHSVFTAYFEQETAQAKHSVEVPDVEDILQKAVESLALGKILLTPW